MNQGDIELMNSLNWYHKIELVGGRVTPGREWDHLWSPIKREMRQVDFRGKRVLDIGTWDGLWSFEAEGLGASSVLATDINTQRSTTWTRSNSNSTVVVFFGVLYHLRYPQLGLARIRNVLKDGGLLLMETAILLDTEDTIIQTDHQKIYPNDVSTWNAFSGPALVSLLKESYFEVERFEVIVRQNRGRKIGRGFALARATSGVNLHHYFPDLYLHRFFEPY